MTHFRNQEFRLQLKYQPAVSESFSSQFDFCSSIPTPVEDLYNRDLEKNERFLAVQTVAWFYTKAPSRCACAHSSFAMVNGHITTVL